MASEEKRWRVKMRGSDDWLASSERAGRARGYLPEGCDSVAAEESTGIGDGMAEAPPIPSFDIPMKDLIGPVPVVPDHLRSKAKELFATAANGGQELVLAGVRLGFVLMQLKEVTHGFKYELYRLGIPRAAADFFIDGAQRGRLSVYAVDWRSGQIDDWDSGEIHDWLANRERAGREPPGG